MTLFDGWFVKKANPDAERNHLNKILQAIKTALEGAVAGSVSSVQPGTGIDVDATDPNNPVVSVEASIISGAGLGATALQPGDNVSELVNDAGYTTNTGTVTSVDLANSTGLTASGGPITTSGSLTYTLSANLQAWHGLATSSKQDTLTNSTSNTVSGTQVQRAALTGDVTASANSNATTIANDAVTNAKAANMAQSTIKGRAAAAGTGDPTDLTPAQVRTIINVADGATANTGTVTSVAAGNGMTFTTITGTGTVTMGTPTTLTAATTNAVTASSHTHEVTLNSGTKVLTDDITTYADDVPLIGQGTTGFPGTAGTLLTAHYSSIRGFQLYSPAAGGTVEPDLYVRTSHTSLGGGGWTSLRKMWHDGNLPHTADAVVAVGGTGTSAQLLRSDGTNSEELINTAGQQTFGLDAYNSNANFRGRRYNGTVGTPTTVLSGETIFTLSSAGHDGTAMSGATGRISFISEGNYTTTSRPTSMLFGTTASSGGNTQSTRLVLQGDGTLRPGLNNAYSFGNSSFRWTEIFATNGAINTSDARTKTAVRKFTPEEISAAQALADEVGFFQFLSAKEVKGEFARDHCGLTVQRAIEVMQEHGLDPFNYGFICYDQWPELKELRNEEGEVIQEARPAGDGYSFRPDQLDRFITKGLHERIKALENRE